MKKGGLRATLKHGNNKKSTIGLNISAEFGNTAVE